MRTRTRQRSDYGELWGVAGIIAAVLVSWFFYSADPAHAGTQRQFDQIRIGWTITQVTNTVDDPGEKADSHTDAQGRRHITKVYVVEDTGHSVWIHYREALPAGSNPFRVLEMWDDTVKHASDPVDRIHEGQPRWRVQNRILHNEGHRTGMYADGKHRHLFKRYALPDDQIVKVEYVGPLCRCGPLVGPYHVRSVS